MPVPTYTCMTHTLLGDWPGHGWFSSCLFAVFVAQQAAGGTQHSSPRLEKNAELAFVSQSSGPEIRSHAREGPRCE